MKVGDDIVDAVFKRRLNKYLALVEMGGVEELCFVPNPGRMKELLLADAPALVNRKRALKRKTACDLVCVMSEGGWVSLDSRMPNKLFLEALRRGDIGELRGHWDVSPEYRFGNSRFDFLLEAHGRKALVEVKSCTLVVGGVALFPDAPTKRGQRHLLELVLSIEKGFEPHIFFIIQRNDAKIFSPNDATDRAFGDALRHAGASGVKIAAYRSIVGPSDVKICDRVPLELNLKRAG